MNVFLRGEKIGEITFDGIPRAGQLITVNGTRYEILDCQWISECQEIWGDVCVQPLFIHKEDGPMVQPKVVSCSTFRATYTTAGLSEFGTANLVLHEEQCRDCRDLGTEKRGIEAAEEITCARWHEIRVLGDEGEWSDAEYWQYLKHVHGCVACQEWSHKDFERVFPKE